MLMLRCYFVSLDLLSIHSLLKLLVLVFEILVKWSLKNRKKFFVVNFLIEIFWYLYIHNQYWDSQHENSYRVKICVMTVLSWFRETVFRNMVVGELYLCWCLKNKCCITNAGNDTTLTQSNVLLNLNTVIDFSFVFYTCSFSRFSMVASGIEP